MHVVLTQCIRNKNTRQAYYHAVTRFFAWVDRHKLGEIADIEPLHVAAYVEALGRILRNRRSNSIWPRSACASTGW
jgi:site-specific recombinase XerD